jgi:AcrR family transcriptional regulator
MTTPDRILRAKAQACDPSHFAFTERQRQRHERVIAISQHLIAEEGCQNITFRGLARALRMSTAALRFHFVDMEALLAEIIRRHLRRISAALGRYEPTDPTRHQKRRAAYLAYTRTPDGGFTEAHQVLVRDGHTLPDDERKGIEMIRRGLGKLLAGDQADEAFLVLDAPSLDPAAIEARLGAPPHRQQAPEPAKLPIEPWEAKPGEGEKPDDWIFTSGSPTQSRAPPLAA